MKNDLSERLRIDFHKAGKGSSTPQNTINILLAEFFNTIQRKESLTTVSYLASQLGDPVCRRVAFRTGHLSTLTSQSLRSLDAPFAVVQVIESVNLETLTLQSRLGVPVR